MKQSKKILILRFSSFGDIVQCLSSVDHLQNAFPQSEIHWATRNDFASFVSLHPFIHQIWQLNRKDGIKGLYRLAQKLRKEKFTHIYDAHSNLRSHILCWILLFPFFWKYSFVRRKKHRLRRWFLLKWKIRTVLPFPFRGAKSYVTPLKKWNIQWQKKLPRSLISRNDIIKKLAHLIPFSLKSAIVLAPSAAWEMKRWPKEYWQQLIAELNQQNFIIVGGKEDTFCSDIALTYPHQAISLAGHLSWEETAFLVQSTKATVSGDTGVLHLSDYLNKPSFAIIGPTAFGFPSWDNTKTFEISLACRPCTKDGRGKCVQSIYKKCLVDISPSHIVNALLPLIASEKEEHL